MTARTENALLVINVKLSSRKQKVQKGRVVITRRNLTSLQQVCETFCVTHGLPLRTASPIVLANVQAAVQRFLAKNPKILETIGPGVATESQQPLRPLQPCSPVATAPVKRFKRKNLHAVCSGRKETATVTGDKGDVIEEVDSRLGEVSGKKDDDRHWSRGEAAGLRVSSPSSESTREGHKNMVQTMGRDPARHAVRSEVATLSARLSPFARLHQSFGSTRNELSREERAAAESAITEAGIEGKPTAADSLIGSLHDALHHGSSRSGDPYPDGSREDARLDGDMEMKGCQSHREEMESSSSEELYAQLFRKYSMQPDVTVPTSKTLKECSPRQRASKSERLLACERLHRVAAQREKDREAARRLHELQQELDDLAECTFRPAVNAGYQPEGSNRVEERLLAKGRLRKKRLESSIEQRLVKEMEECSFRPEISAHARSLSTSISILYEDAMRRQQQSTTVERTKSHKLTLSSNEERSRIHERLAKQRIGNFRHTQDNNECTFQPRTGRGPLRQRRGADSNSVHISSVLYACRNEAAELRQFLQKQQAEQEIVSRERRRPRHWR